MVVPAPFPLGGGHDLGRLSGSPRCSLPERLQVLEAVEVNLEQQHAGCLSSRSRPGGELAETADLQVGCGAVGVGERRAELVLQLRRSHDTDDISTCLVTNMGEGSRDGGTSS